MERERLLSVFLWHAGVHSVCPCASSELVHFRKCIGEEGIELIFQESIRVNNEDDEDRHHDTAFIDSTVQEKNITYPTDAKLHRKIAKKVLGLVNKLGLPLRQNYTFVLKEICVSGIIPRTGKKLLGQTGVCVQ